MGLPDCFGAQVDWLPEGTIVCPDLPPGEVLATRYPIRTKHDVQIWHNLDWQTFQSLGLETKLDECDVSRFFRYARGHKGVVFMSHATAKRVGGDFDVFQLTPVTRHKPLDQIDKPNRDWSDLAPLADQVRREGWGGITPKGKRRLATHVAPERPEEVTADNHKGLCINNFPVSDRQRLACFLRSLTLLQENGHDSNSLTARLIEASRRKRVTDPSSGHAFLRSNVCPRCDGPTVTNPYSSGHAFLLHTLHGTGLHACVTNPYSSGHAFLRPAIGGGIGGVRCDKPLLIGSCFPTNRLWHPMRA
jgi:hypothetical protein